MADKPNYLVGNTHKLAAEWSFDFVVSRAESNDKVSDEEIDAFWDKVLDVVEDCGLSLGGSYKPITDADYEKMDREDPVCICPSYPFEPEGEQD